MMMKLKWMMVFAMLGLLAQAGFGQDHPIKPQVDAAQTDEREIKGAEFPGGSVKMMQFVTQEAKYPKELRKDKLTGKVYVQFIVSEDGTLTDIKVVKELHEAADAEAIRVIKAMPTWKPGTQNGKAVKQRMTLPIAFRP